MLVLTDHNIQSVILLSFDLNALYSLNNVSSRYFSKNFSVFHHFTVNSDSSFLMYHIFDFDLSFVSSQYFFIADKHICNTVIADELQNGSLPAF